MVIAPHMDDEVLGCAGTICRHTSQDDSVSVVFVANRVYNHRYDRARNAIEEKHARQAQKVLGYDRAVFLGLHDERLDSCLQEIIVPLEMQVKTLRPQIVYIPFRSDNNQDHRAVFDAARVALRPAATPFIKAVHMYEVSSSTEQSPPLRENAFLPNHYVDISRFIQAKLKALSCYESEIRQYPHPRSARALKALAEKRGVEIGLAYAEAFMTIRSTWKE